MDLSQISIEELQQELALRRKRPKMQIRLLKNINGKEYLLQDVVSSGFTKDWSVVDQIELYVEQDQIQLKTVNTPTATEEGHLYKNYVDQTFVPSWIKELQEQQKVKDSYDKLKKELDKHKEHTWHGPGDTHPFFTF